MPVVISRPSARPHPTAARPVLSDEDVAAHVPLSPSVRPDPAFETSAFPGPVAPGPVVPGPVVDGSGRRRGGGARRAPARRALVRRALVWGGGAGVVLVAAAAWIAWTGWQAKAQLQSARAVLPALQSAVLTGDGTAGVHLAELRAKADAADGDTHDPVWSAVAAVPILGSPLATTQRMTRAVDTLATRSLPALVSAADTLHPSALLTGGGHLDVAGLAAAAPALERAASSLRAQQEAVAATAPSWFGPVTSARRQLLTELTSLSGTSRDAAAASRLVPPMLGSTGVRKYFVAFQNPAEARATGGLLDAYAIVVADHGSVRIERMGANTQLPSFTGAVTDVDPAFAARYGPVGATSAWLEANVSPNFPDVARDWEAMWRKATGEALDGAVALDPQALSAVLSATGPISAPVVGEVDADRIESLVLHDQYTLPQLADHRKNLMLGIGAATVARLMAGGVSPRRLFPAVSRAADSGHLLISSRVADEESQLVSAGIGGAVAAGTAPFAQAVAVNAAGNKLDDWLQSSLRYVATTCTAVRRVVEITVTLRNSAPSSGLPQYMTVRSDDPAYTTVPGQNRTQLQVLLTRGATLLGATLDGGSLLPGSADGELPASVPADAAQVFLTATQVSGRPSYWLDLETVPGGVHTVVLRVAEPPSRLAPQLPLQAMALQPTATADVRACSGSGDG